MNENLQPQQLPSQVQLENIRCPLGCDADDVPVLAGRDRLHDLPGWFTVIRCSGCGLLRTNPRPTAATIGYYYPDNYGPYAPVPEARRVQLVDVPLWKRVSRRVLEFNTAKLPLVPIGRLLEIGCASGSFLDLMASSGWDVEGIEFSASAARSAQELGHKVHVGSLESIAGPKGQFDLVVGWMVLEHLHDPVTALRRLREWTKPEGWLVLSVPNASALQLRLFGNAWYALQLPTHLYHYTPSTVRKVLALAGWRVERILHQRLLSEWIASFGYLLQDRNRWPKLARVLIDYPEKGGYWHVVLFPIAYVMSLFGQTGRMTVWATKSE